jgi:polar amino acid transport system substrate-binding protein
MRRIALSLLAVSALGLAACGGSDSASDTTAPAAAEGNGAGNECTAGKTLAEGKLTIATGNPAYGPWRW